MSVVDVFDAITTARPYKPAASAERAFEELEGEVVDEKKIRAFGVAGNAKHHDWKRKTHTNGTGAGRVRSFHGKLSDQGMQYLDDAINEWLEREDSPLAGFVRDFYPQGGFAIGATVARHSSDDEFDIDVMADLAFREMRENTAH